MMYMMNGRRPRLMYYYGDYSGGSKITLKRGSFPTPLLDRLFNFLLPSAPDRLP